MPVSRRAAGLSPVPPIRMQRVFRELSRNWKSGLTVALVSVPLSLSLAIASGAQPIAGIITAVWAGLAAAAFGGSAYNVIGPAGALSGILAAFALTHGPEALPLLAVASGGLILVFWRLRWDRYLVFIPSSVMHGFTLGVALTIAAGQINFALGLSALAPRESVLLNAWESLSHAGQAGMPSVAVFAVTLCLLFGLARWMPRIPPAVAAAALGIVTGWLGETHLLPFAVPTLLSKYGAFQASLVHPPALSAFIPDLGFLEAVFTVTVVAVLETLLSAKIVDGMTGTRFNQKKEMRGLGIANIISGLAGGLPATGVLARTALNAKSGATSSVSSAINAACVGLIALVLFGWFQYLPLPVVAGILVFAAVRMVETHHFTKIFRYDPVSFWLSLLVAALTFAVDPMVGILAGASIALLQFAHRLSRGQSELTLHKDNKVVARVPHGRHQEYGHSDIIVYRLAGELTYFNAKSHEDAIHHAKADTLIVSLRNLFYLDLDGAEILEEIVAHEEKSGRAVYLTGANAYILPMLERMSWFKRHEKEGKIFPSTSAALEALGFPLPGEREG